MSYINETMVSSGSESRSPALFWCSTIKLLRHSYFNILVLRVNLSKGCHDDYIPRSTEVVMRREAFRENKDEMFYTFLKIDSSRSYVKDFKHVGYETQNFYIEIFKSFLKI
jgi:hypothetical protein